MHPIFANFESSTRCQADNARRAGEHAPHTVRRPVARAGRTRRSTPCPLIGKRGVAPPSSAARAVRQVPCSRTWCLPSRSRRRRADHRRHEVQVDRPLLEKPASGSTDAESIVQKACGCPFQPPRLGRWSTATRQGCGPGTCVAVMVRHPDWPREKFHPSSSSTSTRAARRRGSDAGRAC